MSDQKVIVYQHILELADTTLEGLEHIQARTMEGCFEDTVDLYTDVADSMCQMQTALATVLPDYEESDLNTESDKVVESMQLVLAAYEGDKEVRPMEVMQFAMLPAYRRWHNQLQEELLENCAPQMH